MQLLMRYLVKQAMLSRSNLLLLGAPIKPHDSFFMEFDQGIDLRVKCGESAFSESEGSHFECHWCAWRAFGPKIVTTLSETLGWNQSSVVDEGHGEQEGASLSVARLCFENSNLLMKKGRSVELCKSALFTHNMSLVFRP